MKLIEILYFLVLTMKVLLIIACMIIALSEPVGYSTGEDYGSTLFWIAKFLAIGYLFYECRKLPR